MEHSDPVTAPCGEGVDLRVQVELDLEGRAASLNLVGEKTKIEEIRQVTMKSPVISLAVHPEGKPMPTTAFTMAIELPTQSVTNWSMQREMPLGSHVILRTDLRGGEKARVLIARVRELK